MVHLMRETENTKDESNGLLFNNLLLFPKISSFVSVHYRIIT